jgi:hypothetical protein
LQTHKFGHPVCKSKSGSQLGVLQIAPYQKRNITRRIKRKGGVGRKMRGVSLSLLFLCAKHIHKKTAICQARSQSELATDARKNKYDPIPCFRGLYSVIKLKWFSEALSVSGGTGKRKSIAIG